MADRQDQMIGLNKKDPEGLGPNGKPYKVLVVDDSAVMRMIIIKILKSELYEIVGEAENGEAAVELFKEYDPDIVTMDVHMPIMDGLVALKEMCSYDSNACVIMLTSDSEESLVKTALIQGAKDFILKPPERRTVLEKVKKNLR